MFLKNKSLQALTLMLALNSYICVASQDTKTFSQTCKDAILSPSGILFILHTSATISLRVYDWINKDIEHEKNVKLLTDQQKIINKQTISLNKYDANKEEQRIKENHLYLKQMEVTIEKGRLDLQQFKAQAQAENCQKLINSFIFFKELLPLVSEQKRASLQEEIDNQIQSMVKNGCGFSQT